MFLELCLLPAKSGMDAGLDATAYGCAFGIDGVAFHNPSPEFLEHLASENGVDTYKYNKYTSDISFDTRPL